MKRLAALAVLPLVAVGCQDLMQPSASRQPGETPGSGFSDLASGGELADYVPGRVLARFAPDADRTVIAERHGARIQRELRLDGVFLLDVPEGAEERVASALNRKPNVVYAEPDFVRTFGLPCGTGDGDCTAPDDILFEFEWDRHNDGDVPDADTGDPVSTGKVDADIDWLEAFDQLGAFTGAARIGIIDTGIFDDHPDLGGRVALDHDFLNGDPDAEPAHWHATHVAGIAGAVADNGRGVTGVAYGTSVEFLDAKVCSASGCPTSAIVEAITWTADNGAHTINLSLGGRFGSSAEQEALQYALNAGALPFCASGNDGSGRVSYPAAFPECVAVGATDWNDERASYSNHGAEVELSAPGGDTESAPESYVLSTYWDSQENAAAYAWAIGTSMATPQAAGAGAVLHATGHAAGPAGIRQRLRETADDLGSPGRDRDFGYGRINLSRAVGGTPDGGGGGGTNSPPTAEFTSGCASLTCDFDASGSSDSDGSVSSYDWDFGDGTTGSGVTVSHTYAADGTYTVTLTVTDDDGATDSHSQDVMVASSSASPEVTSIDPSTMPAGSTVDVTIGGSGFVDGATVTFENGSGPAPDASAVNVVDGSTITASVTAKSGGPPRDRVWDVVVTNPDGSSGVLSGGFTVTP